MARIREKGGAAQPGAELGPSLRASLRKAREVTPSKKRKSADRGMEKQIVDPVLDQLCGNTTQTADDVTGQRMEKQILNQVLDQVLGKTTHKADDVSGTKVSSQDQAPDQVRVGISDERRDLESTKENAQKCRKKGDQESDFSSNSQWARGNELEPSFKELVQRAKFAQLRREINAERSALHEEKSKGDVELATTTENLVSVARQRDEARKILVIVCQEKRELEKVVMDLQRQKSDGDRRLSDMSEKMMLSEQAWQKKLEQVHNDFETERTSLVANAAQAVKEKVALETKLAEKEKELELKTLCQECLESSKDTICFPCLHIHYCSRCMDKRRKGTNTCPSCWTDISVTLKCQV